MNLPNSLHFSIMPFMEMIFLKKKNICVKILDYNTKCFKNVESIINSLSCSKKIIIVSDSLDLKDLINKITKENFILTIPCYFDEINDKIKTIKDFLKINDISSTDEFIENFAKLINGDRMVLMQELEKVNVYFLNSNNKTLDKNYLENIYDNSFSTSDEIIDQIMLQDYEIFKNLEKILSYNIDFFPFLLSFERHLNLIYLKLCKIKFENSNIENELKYVFFKRLNKIKYQLEKLSIKKINSIAKRISKIQHDFLIYGENFAIIEFKKFLFDYYKK